MPSRETKFVDYSSPYKSSCAADAGCGGAICLLDFATGAVEQALSLLSTPREGNFRLQWYNRWQNSLGALGEFYTNAGNNWIIDAFAYVLTTGGGELMFNWSPGRKGKTLWFDLVGSDYVAKFSALETLHRISDTYYVTEPDGTVWEFDAIDGLVAKMTTPGGQVTEYEKSDGLIVGKKTIIPGGYVEKRKFEYDEDDAISTVTLYSGTTLDPEETPVRRVVFSYYTVEIEGKGNAYDLKSVATQVPDGMGWETIATNYYRYYTDATAISYIGGLKYSVGPTGYLALGVDPDDADDEAVAAVADAYYEYDPTTRRATRAVSLGGTHDVSVTYTERSSGDPVDYNHWYLKSVATLPDAELVGDRSTKTIYSNHLGQDMLVDHQKPNDGGRWIRYTKFDSYLPRPIMESMPSAIDMTDPYDDAEADLDVSLREDDGLNYITTYYDETVPSEGKAENYVKDQRAQHGYPATMGNANQVKLATFEYAEETISGTTPATVHPVSKRTTYRTASPAGSDAVAIEYEYTYFSSTTQVETVTETLPDIGSGQNGGSWLEDKTRVQTLNIQGQLIESVDARGIPTAYSYDPPTGTVSQMVQDGSNLNLVTNYESDELGRPTKMLGPEHNLDGDPIRTVRWTVYKDIEHEVWSARGYLDDADDAWLVNPVSITRGDASGRVVDEIQAVRGSGVEEEGALTAEDEFPQTSWTRWTHHIYNHAGQLTKSRVYHLIPTDGDGVSGTNYNESTFAYDDMGRRVRVSSPGGTITWTIYDPRGLVLSTWVGTDDTYATPNNPAGAGSPNNMLSVTINIYDTDAYEDDSDSLDGLLTKVISPVDGDTGNDRITEFRYDWRDRQTQTIINDGTYEYVTIATLDNLGRPGVSEEYRAGSPDVLIAKSETLYDDWGRVYRTRRWGVDYAGDTYNPQSDNTWYDAEGNVLESKPAGSQAFTKNVYDAIGRVSISSTGYYSGSGGESPLAITNDVIFTQTITGYDESSSVLYVISKQRWHDATGNGTLLGPSGSQPKSRDSYLAYWYDGIGRQLAQADFGTNANAGPPTRPDSPPSSSSTVLVSESTYYPAGQMATQVDPAGHTTSTIYDDAGRTTSVTRNSGSSPTETTGTTYTPDGQVETLTAVNSTTGNQTTTYAYGVGLGGSGIATTHLLASVTYPDSGVVAYQYNRQGQRIKLTDQNGSVHEYAYDVLGRQTADAVAELGSGVNGAIRRITWAYDDNRRLQFITSYDAASSGSVINQVLRQFNIFGQLDFEQQEHNGSASFSPQVTYFYASGSANTIRRTDILYPYNTLLKYNYTGTAADKLSRVDKLTWNSTDVVTYDYLGLNQVVKQTYPEPSTDVIYTLATGSGSNPYAGLDQFGRIIDLQWLQSSTKLAQLKYGYDLAGNRTFRRDEVARDNSADFDELYVYDELDRLEVMARGLLNSTNDGLTDANLVQLWTLDQTGNWSGFSQYIADPVTQTRTHNTVNEITNISESVGVDWGEPSYDGNGNMTMMPNPYELDGGRYEATWDAWNRLVELEEVGGSGIATYQYDGMNRRVTKTISGTVRHFYYSDQWQVVEERLDSSGSPDRQYVWGLRYVDDLVLRDRSSERLYALQDALFNVVALMEDDGTIVERFAYQPYGQSVELNPNFGTPYSGTVYDWGYRFTGRELDLESLLQISRNRYLHLQLGRWICRDPIGYADGINLYNYVRNLPTLLADPEGNVACNSVANSTLFVTFKNCSATEEADLSKALCDASKVAWEADTNLQAYDDHLNQWFGEPYPSGDPNHATCYYRQLTNSQYADVRRCLAGVTLAFLHNITINCASSCKDKKAQAQVYSHPPIYRLPWTDPYIYICPLFWQKSVSNADKVETLLHELTHEACGTKDIEYRDGNAMKPNAPTYAAGYMPSAKCIINADSYEGFYEDVCSDMGIK